MKKDKTKLEFLYAGDIWSALWGEKRSKQLAKTIMHAVTKSKPVFSIKDFTFSEYKTTSSQMAFESILKHTKEANQLYSLFPFCKGAENELVFCDILGCEEDNIEGYVKLQKNDAAAIWMYNPLYRQQLDRLSESVGAHNGNQKFMVAGIGWDIIKTPPQSIKIYTGKGDYETALKEFLTANPDKSEDDFPLMEDADASHMNYIDVVKCDDAYAFSSDIYSISEFKCLGTKFYCMEIRVLRYSDENREDETGLRINLYVNKKLLGDYKPQVGDNISGVMQLTAYLPDKREYLQNKEFYPKVPFVLELWDKLIEFITKMITIAICIGAVISAIYALIAVF